MSALDKILISVMLLPIASMAGTASPAAAGDIAHLDRVTGRYWQSVIDPRRPAAPPRLVEKSASVINGSPKSRRSVLCVHAGEQLMVHAAGTRSSAVLLEATALESVACGERVRARIHVTGALTEITVLGQGLGVLCTKVDKWR